MLTFIDNAVKDIRPMAEAKQVTLKLETIGSKALEDAWFDNDKLDKVIYNLISNSIKYNNEGGYVNVKVEEENSKVKISVEDNGIGMSHQQMRKLYERFYDGDYRRMKAAAQASDCRSRATSCNCITAPSTVRATRAKEQHSPSYCL